jgi:ABC-2 type transport system permease protein
VLYVSTLVPADLRAKYQTNPIASVLGQIRHAVVDPTAPSAATLIGGSARLLVPAGIVIAVFAIGLWVFNREAPRIAEDL